MQTEQPLNSQKVFGFLFGHIVSDLRLKPFPELPMWNLWDFSHWDSFSVLSGTKQWLYLHITCWHQGHWTCNEVHLETSQLSTWTVHYLFIEMDFTSQMWITSCANVTEFGLTRQCQYTNVQCVISAMLGAPNSCGHISRCQSECSGWLCVCLCVAGWRCCGVKALEERWL